MNENGEIITKMVSDNWLVAKVSNKREFYAIFNHKNSNLLEIDGKYTMCHAFYLKCTSAMNTITES